MHGWSAGRSFLKPFAIFFSFDTTFSKFPNKIFVHISRDIIGLENAQVLSFSQSWSKLWSRCNLHSTPFELVLHCLELTALSQSSESSNFFRYSILLTVKHLTLNDWSWGKQRILFPENLNFSPDEVKGNMYYRSTCRSLGKVNTMF